MGVLFVNAVINGRDVNIRGDAEKLGNINGFAILTVVEVVSLHPKDVTDINLTVNAPES